MQIKLSFATWLVKLSGNVEETKPWLAEAVGHSRAPWGLMQFYKEHQRFPTAPEVDIYPYLPSARSIERSFGGLVALRQQLGLDTQPDFRSGKHSSERAFKINRRAHKVEQVVYEYLVSIFGTEFVHREYLFSFDRRTRADFFVYDQNKGFCVDVFYPSDRRNLGGCLNSKQRKYETSLMRQYPVIFLQMNEALEQGELDQLIKNKKNTLMAGQNLMSWATFKIFCQSREPNRIKM